MHPSFEVPKTYRVAGLQAAGPRAARCRRCATGVELEDGMTAPALVRRLHADQLDITIHEGRKRQVRRMCEAVGHPVKEIERTAFGPLRLGDAPAGPGAQAHARGDAAPAWTDMMPPAMRLFALRGATSIDRDEASLILDGTTVLLQEILERNALAPTDVVSCIFTCTQDLTAEYPAVAARAMGFNRSRCCARRRWPCPGSLPRVVRAAHALLRGRGPRGPARLPRRGTRPLRLATSIGAQ